MDNNSKETLFGFEAFTDIFNENHNGLIEDDYIDDEELERLKQESAKARPATPGSKNKKTEEEEEEEEEEGNEINEEEEEDKNTKPSKKKTTKVVEEEEEINEEEEEEEGEEEEIDENESKQVSALFDAIAEELDWEFTEEDKDEKPNTVEGLVKYFKDVIKENSVPEYASEEVKELDEFVRNGGKLEDFFSITPDIDLENFDTTDESNQKQIVKMLLVEKGYNEKQINKKLEKYEDAGILEDEAEDALEEMKDISEKKKEELLKNQKKQNEQRMANQQKFFNDVVGEINNMDNVRGIKIPEKDKKALLTYIFKTDANGRTQYQKDYSKSVKNLIESAYFTMKGDTLLDTAKKMGTSSAIKNLKQSLKSTSVSRTRRVNTNSTDSIFSRAVKLL